MSDVAKGILGGILRASASVLIGSVRSSATTTSSAPPQKIVREITERGAINEVSSYIVHRRDKDIILHGPIRGSKLASHQWLIIAHHPTAHDKMWIIFQSNTEEEALAAFDRYNGVISLLISADSTLCDTKNLEKICPKLLDNNNNGWTAAHIAASCNFVSCLKNPHFRKYLDCQEGLQLQTPLHLAIEAKNLNCVMELIQAGAALDYCDIRENSPIHYAAKSSVEILKCLLDKMPERYSFLLDSKNKDEMTPLSIACRFNLHENIQCLLNHGCSVNVPCSEDGYPISIAVKNDSILCIQELVSHSVEQLNLRDPKDGSAPIHWAGGYETLTLLLDLGSDPNTIDNLGRTALHFQTRKGCLKSVLQLLCRHAFPDMKDSEGNTALHLAAQFGLGSILQALICFDADINSVNNDGHSVRHVACISSVPEKEKNLFFINAVGGKRCPKEMVDICSDGCKFEGTFNGIAPANYSGVDRPHLVHEALHAFSSTREVLARSRRNSLSDDGQETQKLCSDESYVGGRLLCLDGGGIRGLILTQILMCLQKELTCPVIEVFDWIAGTSTGGILALGLASKKSPVELQALYLRLKDKVFSGSRPYSSEQMEDFLKKEFGSETKMSNLRRPKVMITTAIADQRPADFHFFRSYLSPSVILGEEDSCTRGPEDLFVWEVAKATGAAPSYFRLDKKYIDGGLVANNPTIDALTELIQLAGALKTSGNPGFVDAKFPSVVVSLGTGILPKVKCDAANYDVTKPIGFLDAVTTIPKLGHLIALLVEQATQTEGQIVERSRAWCASLGIPFYRFSPKISKIIDLDETDDETLVHMMWETRAYVYHHRDSIMSLKHVLFANGPPPLSSNTNSFY